MSTTVSAFEQSSSAIEPRPPIVLTAIETAIRMGLPAEELEKMRRAQRGPRYYRLNGAGFGKIVYLLDDVEAWLEQHARRADAYDTKP